MPAARIARASAADCEVIEPLFTAYRSFYRLAPDPERALLYLRERLERNESVVFLAWDGARAAGFTQMYPSFSSLGMCRAWILNDLFVAPEARGNGTARSRQHLAADRHRQRAGPASLRVGWV
jgi:GNAT superfamily N-acetyltransferase